MSEFLELLNIAQIVGFIASGFLAIAYLTKSELHFKLIISVAFAFFGLHFYMLGAFMGMFVSAVDVARMLLSIKKNKTPFVMIFFILLYVGVGLYNFETIADIFPILASTIATFAVYRLTGLPFRIMLFVITACWLSYSLFVFSMGGIIVNILLLLANCVTIYRLKNEQKKQTA